MYCINKDSHSPMVRKTNNYIVPELLILTLIKKCMYVILHQDFDHVSFTTTLASRSVKMLRSCKLAQTPLPPPYIKMGKVIWQYETIYVACYVQDA